MLILYGHLFNIMFAHDLFVPIGAKKKKRTLNPKVVSGANAVVVVMFICAIFDFLKNHFVSQILSAPILLILIFLNVVHTRDIVDYEDMEWLDSHLKEQNFVLIIHGVLLTMFMIAMPKFYYAVDACTNSWEAAILFCLFGVVT